MLIGFRVDASLKMGTGHLFRCLTLADQLSSLGHDVVFFCRALKGNLIELVDKSYPVVILPTGSSQQTMESLSNEDKNCPFHCAHASWLEVDYKNEIDQVTNAFEQTLAQYHQKQFDWVISDHYAIEYQWHHAVRPYTHHIMQIDDLADRNHDCDVLLDQNFYLNGDSRYQTRLPTRCKLLAGPFYALLRPEFKQARDQLTSYEQRKEKRNVVLFFGGIDNNNETGKALKGLLDAVKVCGDDNKWDHFDVIVGANNPNISTLEAQIKKSQSLVTLHVQVPNMMDFFAKSYLYVGAVGATTWERCVLALPGLVCSVADNQTQLANDLHEVNGHHYLGLSSTLTSDDYKEAYIAIRSQPAELMKQSQLCADMIDGMGCKRVCNTLVEISAYE